MRLESKHADLHEAGALDRSTASRSEKRGHRSFRTIAAIALGSALAATACAQRFTVHSGLVLNGVTIVDTHDGKLMHGMAIAIDGGKITKIGRAGTLVAGAPARLIDARGKYVVPGYWEMHGHPLDGPDKVDDLKMMLAYGITGLRQMSGSDEMLKERREGTLMPASDSPELLAMPGAILLHGNAPTVAAAIAEVDKQKAEGADFIKTIDVSPQVFFAAEEEAKRVGLPYDGHLSAGVDAVKASEAGMRGIEHLGPMETLLLSCSTDEAAMRQAVARHLAAAAQHPHGPAPTSLTRAAVSDPVLMRALVDPGFFVQAQHVIDTYSEDKCRHVAQVFVEHQTWQTPTLIRLRTMEFGDDPAYRNDPNLRYVAPATRAMWDGVAKKFAATITPADQATLTQLFALQMKVAKLFDDSGVKMMAGSDLGGIWLVPGFSLHQEFDLLAQDGFTPLKVLQMTTLDGAEFLGREATDGSVGEGKYANLVLLDGNPMDSVQNLHKIYAVVRGGSYYSKDALDSLKQKVQQDMASRKVPAPAAKN